MLRILLSLSCFLIFTVGLFAQKQFSGTPLKSSAIPSLDEQFKAYEVYQIDATDIHQYSKDQGEDVSFQLKLGNNHQWKLGLVLEDIVSPSYVLSTSYGVDPLSSTTEKARPYQGYVNGQANSRARLTLNENFIYGYVSLNDEIYFIEPLSYFQPLAENNLFVVYNQKDVLPKKENKCAAIELGERKQYFQPQMEIEPEAEEKVVGQCLILELAIASDYSMFQKYGSIAGVENHNVAVMNNVQGNFDDEFADEIQFLIVEQFVVNTSGGDPWTSSTNAGTLLNSFRNWGPSGFSAVHDLGQLWTDRNLDGSTIGVAYVGQLCTGSRYHLLQDFSNNAQLLRVLTAHEIGHNLDAVHDGSGTWIMSPTVSTATNWSALSVSDINNEISQNDPPNGCLSSCLVAPLALFSANLNVLCPGSYVNFYDQSLNSPDTWSWSFPGGTPSTSNERAPTIQYMNPGSYTVSLTVSNSAGSNSITQSGIINVTPVGGTDFFFWEDFENGPVDWLIDNPDNQDTWTWETAGGTNGGDRVMRIDNFNYNTNDERDGLISPTLDFFGRSTVTLEVEYAYARYSNQFRDSLVIYVSTDDGATFPHRVFAATENGGGNFATAPQTTNAFNPSELDDWCYGGGFGNNCLSINLDQFAGEPNIRIKLENVNDFGNRMYIDNVRVMSDCQVLLPPVAEFSADATDGCIPLLVNFTDLSQNNPTSWVWTFPGGIPSTSTQQNPSVSYLVGGSYDVILTVANPAGVDTYVLNNYINVEEPPLANFTSSVSGTTVTFNNGSTANVDNYNWDFGDGNSSTEPNPVHTYATDGAYVVTLTVTNECGVDDQIQVVTIINPPTAGFTATPTSGCEPLSVQFSDASSNNVADWDWSFPGGTPSTSTEQNPVVVYDAPGQYDVTLTVTNVVGTDQFVQSGFITVDPLPTAGFSSGINGNTVTFTNQSADGTTYSWDFGDGNSSTDPNPTHTYATDGAYTVTLTASNNCGDDIITQTVDILNPPTGGVMVNDNVACVFEIVQFSDNSSENVQSWFWEFEGGTPGTSTAQNPQVIYQMAGTFDVTLTVTNSAGQDIVALVDYMTIEPFPTAGFSSAVNGTTVDFTNASTDANNYTWDFGDSNTSSSTNPTHTYASDGTYTVMLVAENDCDTDTLFQDVVITTPPIGGFSADVTTGCADLVVQFMDESSDNTTGWLWTFDGGDPATSTDQNPLVTYTQAGIYTVILEVTNSAGDNTVTQVDYIVVDDVPTAGFTESTTDDTVDFTNTSTNANTYSWDFGDGNGSNATDPSHTYAMDGTYTVTLTASNDCGDVIVTQDVVIITPPTGGFSSDVTSGCADLVVQFMDESTENATNWLWTFDGGDPATSTDQNPIVTYTQAGVYDVILEVSNSAGSNTVTKVDYVIVDDVPTPGFTSTTNSTTADFTNTTVNGTTYDWDFGDGNSSNEVDPSHTYAMDGTYMVTLTATNACGSATTTNTVVVSSLPIPGFSSDVIEGCADLIVQFTDESSDNTTGWLWTFEGGDPATSTDQNPQVTYGSPGVYDVTLEVTNSVGTVEVIETGYITVLGLPTPGFQSTINGADVGFTNTSTNGDTYSWDFGDGNGSNATDPTHTYAMDGTYTVTQEVTNACGTVTFTEEITIITPPTAGFGVDVTSGCADLVVQFTDESSENATSWLWTFDGGNPATSMDQNPVVTYTAAGTYSVTLEASNAAGSSTVTQTDIIVVDDVPDAGFTSLVDLAQVDFTNTSTNATSYSWDFGDGNGSNASDPSHTYAMDGVYTVTMTASNACGDVTVTEVVTIVTPPVAGFDAGVTSGCAELTVQFTDASTENATDWLWTFDGGDPATSTEQNPVVVYAQAGTYTVTLEVSNAAGSNTATQTDYIVVDDVPEASFSSIVNGASVDFTNATTNATSYLWDFGDNNTSMDENPSHTYAMDGVYTVTLTASNACGDVTVTEVVTIVTPPSAGFNADITSGCAPLTVQFMDTSSDNTEEWLWTFEGGDPATSTDQNPVVVYNTPGIYAVTLTVTNAAGESTTEELDYIEVLGLPEAAFSSQVNGNEVTFTNASTNGNSFEWDFGDNTTSNETDPVHVYTEDGIYEVVLTVSNECGDVTFTETIAIATAGPIALFEAENTIGCAPFVVQYDNLSSDNAETFEWTFEGGDPATSTDENPTVVYNTPGTYDVTLTAFNQNGSDVITFTDYIVIEGLPEAGFSSTTTNGATVLFTNESVGATSYNWDFGDGTTNTSPDPTHTYGQIGTYLVELIATNGCGSDTITTEVTIDAVIPSAGFDFEPAAGCLPLTVTFTDQSLGEPTAWEWNFDGGSPTTSTDQNPVVIYNTPGIYDVTLIVSNIAGSSQIVMSQAVTVLDVPEASFDYTSMGNEVTFTNTSTGATTYSWEFGDGNTSANPSPVHTYAEAGTYTVTLTVTNECGSMSFEEEITLTTSLEDISIVNALDVYPNPNNGAFNLRLEAYPAESSELRVRLYSVLGQQLYLEQSTFAGGVFERQLDFKHFAKGMYILEIQLGEASTYRKVIFD